LSNAQPTMRRVVVGADHKVAVDIAAVPNLLTPRR
jgi:hypothetical protein